MKKFLLTLGVGTLALSSFATTRILYQQNFENVGDAAEAGWSFGGASMSIASDQFGKFLELSLGQNNGRTGKVTWGQEVFMNENGESILEDGTYRLSYIFSIATGSTNQYNGSMTVFTNHTGIDNQPYRNPWATPCNSWETYLFDMSQVANESLQYAIDAPATGGNAETAWSIDYSEPNTFAAGTWYEVVLEVNVNSREVEYTVSNYTDGSIVKQGTRTVPETMMVNEKNDKGDLVETELPISMYAEGLFLMLARYQSVVLVDDIRISYETSEGFANDPTIALTGVGKTPEEELNLNYRQYTITFVEGETLHVTGTDGVTTDVEYYECEGSYKYDTTTSGTLKAWTTCDGASSQVMEVAVDCAPIVLPDVVATISSVSEGFGKTYTLSVDNSDVPLRPTIFISYEFKGVNGETLSGSDEASGFKLTVSEAGTLSVTSDCFGYQSNTVTVENNIEFETKSVWDFARMTEEELKGYGFSLDQTLNSATTSGFSNWTARKRLYYEVEGSEHEDEAGATVRDFAYPFGFLAEDNTTNVIKYSVIDNSAAEAPLPLFDGLTIFPDKGKLSAGLPNVGMMYRIGLFNDQTTNSNNNIIVNNLDATDFVVVNYINNYGGNSNHPVVANDEDYFKVLAGEDAVYSVAQDGVEVTEGEGEAAVGTGVYTLTHALYRVDTACTKITVFKQKGSQSGVEGVEAEVEGDNWYYSIDGVRMAEPTRPGIYIHNGKKIIVK